MVILKVDVELLHCLSCLLILAGDVELNPGPELDHALSEKQLVTIQEKLYSTRTKWFDIGLNLGIDHETLKEIEMKYWKDGCGVCLREMLSHGLHSIESLTWRKLCDCLESHPVSRKDVAEEIKDWIKGIATGSKRKLPYSDSQDSDSQEIVGQKRSLIEVDFTDAASLLKLDKLKASFKDLTCTVRDSLLRQKVLPYQLSDCLADCYEEEPIIKSTAGRESIKIFRHIKEEFDEKDSMEKFWSKLMDFISFFSFKVLKAIVKSEYADENFREKFENYEKEFQATSVDIVKYYVGEKNMSNFLPTDGTTKLIVKIQKKFTSYTEDHVKIFKINLASAIKVTPELLHLIDLRPGCTLLTYDAPLYVEATAFPLKQDQEEELKRLGVIWLKCGKYRFPSEGENLDPPDSPDSDDEHFPDKMPHSGQSRRAESQAGNLDHDHFPGKQLPVQSPVQDTHDQIDRLSVVSQRTDIEVSSVVSVVVPGGVNKWPAPQSDSGHGSIVSVRTGVEKSSRSGMSWIGNFAVISDAQGPTKGFSIPQSDSGFDSSMKSYTDKKESATINQTESQDILELMGDEYSELAQPSEYILLKMSKSEDKSVCILHEIAICCHFISKVNKMKVVEDKPCTAFTLAAKSGDLSQIKIELNSRNFTELEDTKQLAELEGAVQLAAQAGHLHVVKFLAEECQVNLACQSISGATPLHIAACNGDQKLVEYILSRSIEPLLLNNLNITPLHCACISNNLEVLKALVACEMPHGTPQESETFINVGAEISESLLHCAVWAQNSVMIQYLIDKLGASLNVSCSKGLPPFFLTLVTGNLELASYFSSLESIDINGTIQRDFEGTTESIAPIHVAAFCGHEKILHHLISLKCDATCRLDSNGPTALHLAIANGHLNCVKYLLESVCDFESIYQAVSPAWFWGDRKSSVVQLIQSIDKDDDSKRFVYSEMPVGALPDTRSSELPSEHLFSLLGSLRVQGNQHLPIFSLLTKMGYEHSGKNDVHANTPLHYAARYGDLEAVRYIILELGINPNQPNKYKGLPVHFACMNGHKDIVEFFFRLKQASNHQADNNNWMVLHYAAVGGHLPVIKFLTTEQNCDIMCRDNNGYSPALIATEQGHISALKFLVEALNYNVMNDRTIKGRMAIHHACMKGHLDIVKYLIEECGCDRMGKDNTDSTPAHYAAANGHNSIIKYLSKNDCDITFRNRIEYAPLHLAARHGHLKTIKLLIDELSCEKEEHTISGFTPLHHAADAGHLSIVKYLTVKKNCDIMRKESRLGNTPAHLAIYKGHLEIVKFFCEELKFDVHNERNSLGRFSIHNACMGGHLNVVKYLVEDRNCDPESKDQHDATPMHCAAAAGHIEIVEYLHNKGCDIMCKNEHGENPLHLAAGFGLVEMIKTLSEMHCDVKAKTSKGHTILHCAAAENRLSAVRYIATELNYDVKCKDNDSHTPAHWAVSKCYLDIVKFFVETLSYDINADKNKLGQQAIHIACINGHIDMAKYLVEKCKCDVMSEDNAGFTSLHLATIEEHTEIMAYLHSQGANLMHQNKSNETALHLAARLGKLKALKFLISGLQCDKEALSSTKSTPLHGAAQQGQLHIVEYLTIELKCQTMSKDEYGYTPAHLATIYGHLNVLKFFVSRFDYNVNSDWNDLEQLPIHSVCIKGHIDTIKYLLEECGSDKMSRDKRDGYTPLHCAATCGHNDVIKYLQSKGCDTEDRSKEGETPLHVAASHGKLDTVNFLVLEFHCDQESKTGNEQTPLHLAALKGHLNVVQCLAMDLNCNVMCRDIYEYTPAQLAIFNGHLEILIFFIKNFNYGVNRVKNKPGHFAIHTACMTGHENIVKYLVEECHSDLTCRDASGNTPLHLALESKNIKLMEYLVSKGCDKDAERHDGKTALHIAVFEGQLPLVAYLAIKLRCDIMKKDIDGNTPAHLAAILGHFQILHFFSDKCKYEAKTDKNRFNITLIHSACLYGHVNIVKYLVEELECDPMSEDKNGNTLLHFAAKTGHNDIINYLHNEQGCDIMCRNSLNEAPIHWAAHNGQLETVQLLIAELGCEREPRTSKNQTPLHCAAAEGHLPVVKYLTTEFDFDIVCKDKIGNSPAHLAVIKGHLEVLKFFATNFNYNVNSDRNDNHSLPIHAATFYGYIDIVKYIVEECLTSKLEKNDAYLALSIAVSKEHHKIVAYLHSNGYDVSLKDENGVTVLHSAAQRGQLEAVKFLITELKCDKEIMNIHNETPLHCAATSGHLSIVKYLTTALHCDILRKDHVGDTPAHCAVSNGHLAVVKFCVENLGYNPRIDRNDQLGRLPIHSASMYGRGSTVEYLVDELGCDTMSKDINDTTPMHYAAASGRTAIIKYLHRKGCSIECRNKNGDTPLHTAAEYGRVETVKLFICTLNSDKDVKNYMQHSPLHHAASKGHLYVVRLLAAELKCDIMCRDCDGDTPLQCAVETGQSLVVRYFVEKLNYDIRLTRNNKNQNALHYAALKGHLSIVKYLILKKVDPSCKDMFHNLPLHYAAAVGDYKIAHFLVSNGSPIAMRGIMGKTAADIARINGHKDILQLLDYFSLSLD